MNNKYINSVCFIRKYGSPDETGKERISTTESFDNQVRIYSENKIPATYLLQFDALQDEYYRETVRREHCENSAEVGVWFEVVRPLAEKSKIDWRGRDGRIWDYYVNPGFLMSYTLPQKKQLIDTFFSEFYNEFKFYPKTVGSWLLDSESIDYMSNKYEIDAFIICRKQWGMDGYTLWGGPYYGGYYPCKNNMLCPAQTDKNAIKTPVFRMYTNDPIYCYYEYANKKYNDIDYGLFTQEPAWICGQNPDWVKWQYDNVFNGCNPGFSYIQLGQENGFVWKDKLEKGLLFQAEFAKKNMGMNL